MKNLFIRYAAWGVSVLLGIGVFLFWWLGYPQALSYHEQYQLFMFGTDYLWDSLKLPGGLAVWIGEFLVQFFYVGWAGALVLAMLFVAMQLTGFRLMRRSCPHALRLILSLFPPLLLLWCMGDESVLLSYGVAVVLAMAGAIAIPGSREQQPGVAQSASQRSRLTTQFLALLLIPLLYWLIGPMVWLYVGLNLMRGNLKHSWQLVWLAAVELIAYNTVLQQWPLETVMLTMGYYRIPMQMNVFMVIVPLSVLLIVGVARICGSAGTKAQVRPKGSSRQSRIVSLLLFLLLPVTGYMAERKGFDKDKYELIRQDYFVRNERWDDLIERAEKQQVKTAFSSVCVNLALAQKRQLAERMFDFYQNGEDALLMPSIRDLTSDLPTAEVFFRLGLVNAAQRYMFDIQESILNGKKSGRCTKRIAECMIVNGHYAVARKHLALLKKSLFYRQWAEEAEQEIDSEAAVNAHPVWGRLRQLRFKNDFLFSYNEREKMMGLLFMNNTSNRMALDYFLAQLLLKGDLRGFQQYLGWAQQYGGYQAMPRGYQDAMMCIQHQGNVPGSPYAAYAKRMMGMR